MSDEQAPEQVDVERATEIPDDLVEQVASHDEALAGAVATALERLNQLEDAREALEDEVSDVTGRLKRAHADFENYKKRVERQREEVRNQATDRLVEPLVSIRTDLQRAIDTDAQSVDDLREGVKMTLRDLDNLLDAEDIDLVSPAPGTDVDPRRHEVMVRIDSDESPGTVAEVFEPGIRRGDRIVKPAKVAVSEGAEDADEPSEE